jgi:DNA repair photolyase
MLKHLNDLDERNINYYFQYTLNDYDNEGIEKGVPKVAARIETFQELTDRIGKEKVIWRFDPLILTDTVGVDELLRKVENIGNQLQGYTEKFVFSFADIRQYKKVQTNLDKSTTNYREFDDAQMHTFAAELQKLNQKWNYEIGTCAEPIPLEQYGIIHNKCIDDDLIIRLFPHDKQLMDFLGVKIIPPDMFNPEPSIEKTRNNRDKGQRMFCECIVSKDIGEYNTCPHQCEYCYANTNPKAALANYKRFKGNNQSESISGDF